MSFKSKEKSIMIIKKIIEKMVSFQGKDPRAVAGAMLYIPASDLNELITQKEICKVANITEITLRNRLREIRNLI